jgi:hypothetical protein
MIFIAVFVASGATLWCAILAFSLAVTMVTSAFGVALPRTVLYELFDVTVSLQDLMAAAVFVIVSSTALYVSDRVMAFIRHHDWERLAADLEYPAIALWWFAATALSTFSVALPVIVAYWILRRMALLEEAGNIKDLLEDTRHFLLFVLVAAGIYAIREVVRYRKNDLK